MIMALTTVVVDVTSRIFLSKYFLELFLSRNTRSTESTLHDLREFEVLIPWSISWREIELILYFIEEFFGNNRLVVSLTPIPTSSRIFIHTVVHRIIEDRVYSRDDQWFSTSSPHRSFLEEKSLYGSTTHSFMSYFLEYKLNVWSSLRIYSDFSSISEIASFIRISKWCFMREMSEFCFRLESSDDIYTPVIILELCLRAEDHEKEFLIGSILEYLTVGSYFLKLSLIHEIDHRPEVSSISRESIWSPRENRVIPSLSESIKKSIESFASSWSFRWLTLPDDLDYIEFVSFCYLSHCLDLRLYRKGLSLIIFRWFSYVETVGSRQGFFSERSDIFPRISSSCLRFRGWCFWSFERFNHSLEVIILQDTYMYFSTRKSRRKWEKRALRCQKAH